MTEKSTVLTRNAKEGTHIVSAGNLYRIIASGQETGGRFSVMEAILKPGQGAPLHIHTREDEAFFVLEGEVAFYTTDSEIATQAEGFVSCPPNCIRGFRNNTSKISRMLILYSTSGVEEMTQRAGRVVDRNGISDRTDEVQIECPQLAEEYGISQLDEPLPALPRGHSDA